LPSSQGRPITLADAGWLRPAPAARELSDCAFCNLFLFRHVHNYQVFETPLPHVRGSAYDGAELVIPLSGRAGEWAALLGETSWLYPFAQEEAEALSDRFISSWNEADSDYIYAAEQFRSFQGMKKRRQQLQHFEASFGAQAAVHELSDAESLHSARQILDLWQQESEAAWAETDYTACSEALTHRNPLALFGLVVEVNGAPAGFMLASALSPRMAAIHFAKGLHRFPGIYQFMFRAFAQRHEDFELLNFEQDLGNPRFRQAKQSYRPIHLARKYRLRPKP